MKWSLGPKRYQAIVMERNGTAWREMNRHYINDIRRKHPLPVGSDQPWILCILGIETIDRRKPNNTWRLWRNSSGTNTDGWILSLLSPLRIPVDSIFVAWYAIPFPVVASFIRTLSPGRMHTIGCTFGAIELCWSLMFQEVIMFEISVSPLFSILHGRSQGCDEGHLRFPISP